MRSANFYNDKTIFIVGGSSGIGLAAAKQLAAKGARIHIFARRDAVLQAAQTQIQAQATHPEHVAYTSCDVTDSDHTTQQFAKAVEHSGCPSIVINCAGAAFPNYFENVSADQFLSTLKLNVLGVRNVAAAALPHLKAQGHGHIVNTSSVAGFIGVFGYTDYSASKFAVVGFSEALKQELSQYNIRVSVLYPPDTYTEGFQVEEQTKPEETKAISGNAKLTSPEDVASALIKMLPKAPFHILPTLDGRLTHWAKRWLPSVIDAVIMRTLKKAQRKMGKIP